MRGVSYFVSIFILSLLLLTLASAMPVSDVKLNGYVLDYTNTLSPSTVSNLSLILESLQDQGAAEYVIVIVDNTNGIPIEDYALEIGHNNMGGDEDKGLVTVVSMEDRLYYTAVGYGLEGDLNDAKIGRFQREELVPFFQEGDYGSGLVALALAIHSELLPDVGVAVTRPELSGSDGYNAFSFIFNLLFFFGPIILFIIIRSTSSNSGKKGKKGKGRNGDDFLTAALVASMFLRGGGGSGGNFGGGSGGFGGFSGGGFGGGGAGGGW